jgi:hypothetical protein
VSSTLTRFALAASCLSPIMEALGYLLLIVALARGGWRHPFVAAFLAAVPGYALLLSVWAIAMEQVTGRRLASWGGALRLGAFAVGEQLGYRQWVMWCRLRATASAVGRRGSEPERAPSAGIEPAPASERVRAR